MIPPALGRFIRYWYTYRTVVAVLLGILVSGSMYWLYTQQVACDNQSPDCTIRVSLAPGGPAVLRVDRPEHRPDRHRRPLQPRGEGKFPLDRSVYATALDILNKDRPAWSRSTSASRTRVGADSGDNIFAASARRNQGAGRAGVRVQRRAPLWATARFRWRAPTRSRCTSSVVPIRMRRRRHRAVRRAEPERDPRLDRPDPDSDGVVRKMPMFVEPYLQPATAAARPPNIDALGFAAYRAFSLQGGKGPDLTYSPTEPPSAPPGRRRCPSTSSARRSSTTPVVLAPTSCAMSTTRSPTWSTGACRQRRSTARSC